MLSLLKKMVLRLVILAALFSACASLIHFCNICSSITYRTDANLGYYDRQVKCLHIFVFVCIAHF